MDFIQRGCLSVWNLNGSPPKDSLKNTLQQATARSSCDSKLRLGQPGEKVSLNAEWVGNSALWLGRNWMESCRLSSIYFRLLSSAGLLGSALRMFIISLAV